MQPTISNTTVTLKNGSLVEKLKAFLTTTFKAIQTNQQLTQNQINAINAMPLPIYKYANAAGIFGNDVAINAATEYFATQEAIALLNSLLVSGRQILTAANNKKTAASFTDIDKTILMATLTGMAKAIADAEATLEQLKSDNLKKFKDQYEFTAQMKNMELELRQRLSANRIYGAYIYGASQ